MTAHLDAIRAELDRAEIGPADPVELWWRDDDATRATPALDRLLAMAEDVGTAIGIAAIPDLVHPSLVDRLAGSDPAHGLAGSDPTHRVLVHGLAHRDHAAPGAKAAEFGPHRRIDVMLADARAGLRRIEDLFGSRALPVFVPPWNRIDPALVPRLAGLGFAGLSTFGGGDLADGTMVRVDTHLDPVDWPGTRGLAEPAVLAGQVRRALAAGHRRLGLLTHHLAFDAESWSFTEGLVALAARHPALWFRTPSAVFGAGRGLSNRVAACDVEPGAVELETFA